MQGCAPSLLSEHSVQCATRSLRVGKCVWKSERPSRKAEPSQSLNSLPGKWRPQGDLPSNPDFPCFSAPYRGVKFKFGPPSCTPRSGPLASFDKVLAGSTPGASQKRKAAKGQSPSPPFNDGLHGSLIAGHHPHHRLLNPAGHVVVFRGISLNGFGPRSQSEADHRSHAAAGMDYREVHPSPLNNKTPPLLRREGVRAKAVI